MKRQEFETNRIVQQRPRRSKGYCVCDKTIVSENQRCWNCGRKKKSKKFTKRDNKGWTA